MCPLHVFYKNIYKYSNLKTGLILVSKPLTLLKLNLQQPCILG